LYFEGAAIAETGELLYFKREKILVEKPGCCGHFQATNTFFNHVSLMELSLYRKERRG